MLDGLSSGLMSQMGDAAFGPMGKHMMFTGKQLVNDNVCSYLHARAPSVLSHYISLHNLFIELHIIFYAYILTLEFIVVWTLHDFSAIEVLLQRK